MRCYTFVREIVLYSYPHSLRPYALVSVVSGAANELPLVLEEIARRCEILLNLITDFERSVDAVGAGTDTWEKRWREDEDSAHCGCPYCWHRNACCCRCWYWVVEKRV